MRKLFYLAIFGLSIFNGFSQDLVIMRKGDTLRVTITKNLSEEIEFTYPNETLFNSVSKKNIFKIIFSSGRIEICIERTKLPIINGEDDWNKVIITLTEYDIEGLTFCDTVYGHSISNGIIASDQGPRALRLIKQKASKIGASIILIIEGWDKVKNKPISEWQGAELTGIAYK